MIDADIPVSDMTGKARIRHAALRLFAIHGYAHTSLRTIANEASVSIALITHHFGSKHRLREAVDAALLATFEKAMRELSSHASEPCDENACANLADGVHKIISTRPEIRNYLRRIVVVDGSASGTILLNSLLVLIGGFLERPRTSHGDRNPAWRSLQFFLLAFGPALLEPLLYRSLPGLFAESSSRDWHKANVELLQFGLAAKSTALPVASAPIDRSLRLVAHA